MTRLRFLPVARIVPALGALFVAFMLSVLPAAAQFAPGFSREQALAAFPDAAKTHSRVLRELYGMRGLPPPRVEVASLDQVRDFLVGPRRRNDPYPANTAILLFHIQGDVLTTWVIDGAGLRAAAKLTLGQDALDTAARNLRLSLGVDQIALTRAPRLRSAKQPDYPERKQTERDAAAVAALLYPAPIRAGLKGVEHLVIVGNGVIATIPHAMLPMGGRKALIDLMTVSVSPGLFDLDQMVNIWDGNRVRARPLVVGNPKVAPSAEWDVPDLPGAEAEARAVAATYGTVPLLDAAARKPDVAARMQGASLLYFAAHGVSNPAEPLTGGFLMLSGDTADAGFLRAKELQTMRLSAELAVLSACQSGLGKVHDGGVIGLSRSFQKAGVARVVMTLWSVSDESSNYMMQRFARATLTAAPAMALRQAMLETRAKYPDPVHWSPFVLFGTPR